MCDYAALPTRLPGLALLLALSRVFQQSGREDDLGQTEGQDMKLRVLVFVLFSFSVAFCALAGPLQGAEGGSPVIPEPGSSSDRKMSSKSRSGRMRPLPSAFVVRPDGKVSFP